MELYDNNHEKSELLNLTTKERHAPLHPTSSFFYILNDRHDPLHLNKSFQKMRNKS